MLAHHLDVPYNQGEKRESLVILDKAGHYKGLLKSLAKHADLNSKVEMSDNGMYEINGNGIECGVLRFLQDNEYEVQELMVKRERECFYEARVPFNS